MMKMQTQAPDLPTESVNQDAVEIDAMSSGEIIRLMNREDAKVASAVAAELDAIAEVVDAIVDRLQRDGRLVYVGAGTSGRLGVIDAAECRPTFGIPPGQVVALMAGGPEAMFEAAEAAEDDEDQGKAEIIGLEVGPDDVVVAITASGRTPFVLGAATEARRRGAYTVGLSCNRTSPLSHKVDIQIAVVVGPEVIAGSTRLKAGTAQKMVLNMLSTASMVRLGKVFGNLMVDAQPTNAKLRQRAIRILQEAAGVDAEVARCTLEMSGYETKVALVMLLADVEADEARRRLAAVDGFVRRAVVIGEEDDSL
jgi:N-acetylmuramic acid 6-phosphate etherase